jgi:hypothetical protein
MMHDLLITGDHKRIIRNNYLLIELRDFLELSNSWHHSEIDRIWWKVYARSMQDKTRGQKQFIQKFAHNRIPCNYQQNKFYNYKNSMCCACNSKVETQYHILICTA